MASRPCKPSADTKGLWQWLLPQTPFPACGTGEDEVAGDAAKSEREDRRPREGGGPAPSEPQ